MTKTIYIQTLFLLMAFSGQAQVVSQFTWDSNPVTNAVAGPNATGYGGFATSVSGGVGLAFAELAAGRSNPFDFSQFSLERFGKIDPFSNEWLDRCALARSQKLSG